MNIQNIVRQIKEKSDIANDDLKDATNNTRAMREGNKRSASSALESLKDDYRCVLAGSAAFLIVTGPESAKLTALASPENKSFSAESEALYSRIMAKIDSRAYLNQPTMGSLFNTVLTSLQEVATEIGIQSYPTVSFKAQYATTISSEEQFQNYVKTVVNESLGGTVVGICAVSSVLSEAIARGHAESVAPILLNTPDEALALTLLKDLKELSRNVFVVSVGKASKAIKAVPNSISIKEASPEALAALLDGIKTRLV